MYTQNLFSSLFIQLYYVFWGVWFEFSLCMAGGNRLLLLVEVGANSYFLGAIFKIKMSSDFLVSFYVKKQNPK